MFDPERQKVFDHIAKHSNVAQGHTTSAKLLDIVNFVLVYVLEYWIWHYSIWCFVEPINCVCWCNRRMIISFIMETWNKEENYITSNKVSASKNLGLLNFACWTLFENFETFGYKTKEDTMLTGVDGFRLCWEVLLHLFITVKDITMLDLWLLKLSEEHSNSGSSNGAQHTEAEVREALHCLMTFKLCANTIKMH